MASPSRAQIIPGRTGKGYRARDPLGASRLYGKPVKTVSIVSGELKVVATKPKALEPLPGL